VKGLDEVLRRKKVQLEVLGKQELKRRRSMAVGDGT
jgi:hypothetical protein